MTIKYDFKGITIFAHGGYNVNNMKLQISNWIKVDGKIFHNNFSKHLPLGQILKANNFLKFSLDTGI